MQVIPRKLPCPLQQLQTTVGCLSSQGLMLEMGLMELERVEMPAVLGPPWGVGEPCRHASLASRRRQAPWLAAVSLMPLSRRHYLFLLPTSFFLLRTPRRARHSSGPFVTMSPS